eukprot:4635311-Prymnesium_polylepis.1
MSAVGPIPSVTSQWVQDADIIKKILQLFSQVACAQNMPPAGRRARESAPDARRTSAPGRGAVRKTYTANLAFTAPS